MDKGKILVSNIYELEFQKFNSSTLKQRLEEKYRVKPYYLENRNKKLLSLFSSYVFNLFSVCTSFYFVYSFLEPVITLYPSIFITLFSLVSLELCKRFLLSPSIKQYLQFKKVRWLAFLFSACLISLSALFSYKGANLAFKSFKPSPHLINTDSLENSYKRQLEAIDSQKTALMSVTYKGKVTRTSQKSILELNKQKNELQNFVFNAIDKAEEANKFAVLDNEKKTNREGKYFALFAFVFDMLLILCLTYNEVYDFRSYAEFTEPLEVDITEGNNAPTQSVPISIKPSQAPEENTQKAQPKKEGYGDCLNCGKEFKKTVPHKKYCTTKCRIEAYEKRTDSKLKYRAKE